MSAPHDQHPRPPPGPPAGDHPLQASEAAGAAGALGRLLRRHRLAAGLSQEALAERAGLSLRAISDLERGARRVPYPATVRRLAGALRLSPAERDALAGAARLEAPPHPQLDPDPAPATAPAYPAGPDVALPTPLTSFVGREWEVAEVRRLLAGAPGESGESGESGAPGAPGGRPRLVTLTGAGGIGKTRLALAVAGAISEAVAFVALAALERPELVPQAAAAALGVRAESGRPPAEALAGAVGGRPLLLVLDNCEHLLDACAALAAYLLGACPRLRVLATSREPLGVPGEVLWRVPSLGLPEPPADIARDARDARDARKAVGAGDREAARLVSAAGEAGLEVVGRLGAAPAVRLFVERARAARPDFTLTAVTAPPVAEVCRRSDGIPLAIELAAARVRVLGVVQIAARLDDRLGLLTGGSRTGAPRQQTLRATLDWSYEPLSAPERSLFDRLAVFAGAFSLEAAEAVCADPTPSGVARSAGSTREPSGCGAPGEGLDQADVLPLLSQLVEKSLVNAGEDADSRVRYRLLEPLREYAAERLAARGRAAVAGARRHHAAYYAAVAERAQPALAGPDQVLWLGRLEVEHDNLRAALAWCAGDPAGAAEPAGARQEAMATDSQEAMATDIHAVQRVTLGLRLAAALAPFWRARGHVAEGRRWLDSLLAAPGAPRAGAVRARALLAAGVLAREQGDTPPARAALEEALALAAPLSDQSIRARALAELGRTLLNTGEMTPGKTLLEQGANLARSSGSQRDLGQALVHLAALAEASADFTRARGLLEEALLVARPTGDRFLIAEALLQLARRDIIVADFGRARSLLEEGLALATAVGSPELVVRLRLQLGVAVQRLDDVAGAERHFRAALDLARRIGYRADAADALLGLGEVALARGDVSVAEARMRRSLALFRDLGGGTGGRWGTGLAQQGLVAVARQRGDLPALVARLRELLVTWRDLDDRLGVAGCLLDMAGVAVATGQAPGAVRLLGAADRIRRDSGAVGAAGPGERAASTLRAARAGLDPAAVDAAWASGQALELDAAIAEALTVGGRSGLA